MTEIAIHTPTIQLDQLLKLAGVIQTGGEVRFLLEEERIRVRGEIETARRRKLSPGDEVALRGEDGREEVFRVVAE